jgi:hypothetical protein
MQTFRYSSGRSSRVFSLRWINPGNSRRTGILISIAIAFPPHDGGRLAGSRPGSREVIPVSASAKTRRGVLRVRSRFPKACSQKYPLGRSRLNSRIATPFFAFSPIHSTVYLPIARCNTAITRDFRQWKWHLRVNQRLKRTFPKTTPLFFAETPLFGSWGGAIGG